MLIWLNLYNAVGVNIATQTEKKKTKFVAKDTANGLTRAATELKVVKIIITTKRKRGLKMPEYIKLEPLRDEILNDVEYDGDIVNYFLGIVDSQPAADVAEVKHGEWIYHEMVASNDGSLSGYSCSECSGFVDEEVFDSDEFHKSFCGCCGAKMDKKEGVKSDL